MCCLLPTAEVAVHQEDEAEWDTDAIPSDGEATLEMQVEGNKPP